MIRRRDSRTRRSNAAQGGAPIGARACTTHRPGVVVSERTALGLAPGEPPAGDPDVDKEAVPKRYARFQRERLMFTFVISG